MTDDRHPPQDIDAERAVLGACLAAPRALATAQALLSDEDWYRPAHLALWQLMRTVQAGGAVVDPISVNNALKTADEHTRRNVTGVLIADLYGAVATTLNVAWHAQLVADAGLRRRVITAAMGAIQRAHETASPAEVAEWAATEMAVVKNTQNTPDPTDCDIHSLLAEQHHDEWVTPGLLARGDRLILTSTEGFGKSTMLRQIAVCAAAGLHPFARRTVDAQRVLVVDCENGRKLSKDRYRPLVLQADAQSRPVEDRLRLDIRPSGLNLLSSADSAYLLRMVERVRPDLLLIGPIYRLHEEDPNDERTARRVAAVLDHARAASGCAVITEAHTPHSDGPVGNMLRPVGSSLWKRWPEFGYCMRPAKDTDYHARQCRFVPWRGPRDEREWPEGLVAGGEWPWSPLVPEVARYVA